MLSVSDAEKLVHAFMTFTLDYCNDWTNNISLAKHSYNASHNLVLQLYLIKHTLLCFSLGYTDHFIQGYSWMEQQLS